MEIASIVQINVFIVNGVSFKNNHVNNGNTKYEIAKATNLAVHASGVISKLILAPSQNAIPAGIPNIIWASKNLSAQNSQANWE